MRCAALLLIAGIFGCERTADVVQVSQEQRVLRDATAEQANGMSESDESAREEELARMLRERLVRRIEGFDRPWGGEPWDQRVLEAVRRVPRHRFVPQVGLHEAYRDSPQPIGQGQTISQPTVVALMSNALQLRGGERVLEIGTGSGYQAAILGELAAEVYSIEVVPSLGREAADLLSALGYDNVHVRVGDGYAGWPEEAPFDRILLTAAPLEVPRALFDQLADGGVLVAPVGGGVQELVRWTRRGQVLREERLGAVRFVPMVPGGDDEER